jgi:chloramphenicol 3-O-phosphotransferase
MCGKAILLCGVSSAGKTSLARAIQRQSSEVFYLLSIDDFISMAGERAIEADFARVVLEAVENLCHTLRVLCDLGRNVIADVVCVNDGTETLAALIESMRQRPVLLVGVACDLVELERRERERGDRETGQARWQVEHAYGDMPSDLIADTTRESPEICAAAVLRAFADPGGWSAFQGLDASRYRRDPPVC